MIFSNPSPEKPTSIRVRLRRVCNIIESRSGQNVLFINARFAGTFARTALWIMRFPSPRGASIWIWKPIRDNFVERVAESRKWKIHLVRNLQPSPPVPRPDRPPPKKKNASQRQIFRGRNVVCALAV